MMAERAARRRTVGTRSRLRRVARYTLFAVVGLLCLIVPAACVDSYLSHRQISWGDRHRGSYRSVHSDSGGLFFEQRTNCDIDHRFTYYRTRAYGYKPRRPTRSMKFLGFGFHAGTEYIWPAFLYGSSQPAFTDPRWQKEPYRLLRIPYWFLVAISLLPGVWWMRRSVRRWREESRPRQGLCVTCGYNLTGNISGVCPECGQKLDAQVVPKR
jgi:hypothetical protein